MGLKKPLVTLKKKAFPTLRNWPHRVCSSGGFHHRDTAIARQKKGSSPRSLFGMALLDAPDKNVERTNVGPTPVIQPKGSPSPTPPPRDASIGWKLLGGMGRAAVASCTAPNPEVGRFGSTATRKRGRATLGENGLRCCGEGQGCTGRAQHHPPQHRTN